MHRFPVFLGQKVMLLRRPLYASMSPLRCSIGKCYVLSVTSADVSHNPAIRATRVQGGARVTVLTSSQHTAYR